MDGRLEIYTLGGVRILRGGVPVAGLSNRKAIALLIYLASTRRPQPREVLADLLWDERTQSQALAYLRVALNALHNTLGDSLLSSREMIALNPSVLVWLDALQLEECLKVVHRQGKVTAETATQVAEALELYTLCADPGLQNAFIDELLRVVGEGQGRRRQPCSILITLRADFMGQALAHRPFADALQEAVLLMGPMNRPELRSAIAQPAEMQGAAFEAGLVERILDDVGEKPGVLPLLEFTLTQLWERQTDGWLTHGD